MKKLLFLLVVALLAMSACTELDNTASENKAIVQRWFDEAWHNRNVAAVDEFFSPDFVGYDGSIEVRGIENVRQYVTSLHNAFSDMRVTAEDQVTEGDKIAVRFLVKATHQGEYLDTAPTGKQVTWTGIFIARIAGGKFVEVWQNWDALSLMEQLRAETTMK